MPYNEQTRRIQELLATRFDKEVDVDGYFGPGTAGAILSVLEDVAGESGEVTGAAVDATNVARLRGYSWRPQFDGRYKAIEIVPGGDTIGRSGCLTSCIAMAVDDHVPDVVAVIRELGGYDENSILTAKGWEIVEERYSVTHKRDIGLESGLAHLRAGTPLILHYPKGHRLYPRGHFTVAIGVEDGNAFRVLDPGKGAGNGNEIKNEFTVMPFGEVARIDVLAKRA